jgi:hypothetical protein
MKKIFIKKYSILFILFLTPLLLNSQTQIGSDIDGEVSNDQSSRSISLSSDGSTVAIGARDNDGNGENSGHVRIYRRSNGRWSQIGSDIDGEASSDFSGVSVSLSSNGSAVAIGAHFNDGNGENSGHVRVYLYNNGRWEQTGSDIDGEASGDFSGSSISLSSNGSIVAIGALSNDGNGDRLGHVRVYSINTGNWIQIGNDIDGEAVGDQFGSSVSLSANGSIVAIGGILNNGTNGNASGHVRVYRNNSGNWEQIGNDIDGEAVGDHFGKSVSLSANGSIIAIGSHLNDGNGTNSGHVRIYKNNNGSWDQIGSDIDGEALGDQSGISVSLSSDGSIVAIGSPRNNGTNGNASGHVRVYRNNFGIWEQIGIDIDGEASSDFSGVSVSLSANGNNVAIGAPFNNGNETGRYFGHVRVYDLSRVLQITDFLVSKFSVFPNPVKNYFTIQLKENIVLKKVTIYNNIGQFIKSSKKLITDTFILSKGIYVLKIETDKGTASKKLVIE